MTENCLRQFAKFVTCMETGGIMKAIENIKKGKNCIFKDIDQMLVV